MPIWTVPTTGSSPSPAMSRVGLSIVLALVISLVPMSVFVLAYSPGEAAAAPRDGTLDKSFDDDGIALTEISSFAGATEAVVQRMADGSERILVLDESSDDVWRFFPDGRLDAAFHDDGVLPLQFDDVGDITAIAISPGAEGEADRFVVSGLVYEDMLLVRVTRFEADGSHDTSFGSLGSVDLPDAQQPPPAGCAASPASTFSMTGVADVGVQSDGSVVAVGSGPIEQYEPGLGGCVLAERYAVVAARISPAGEVGAMTAVADQSGSTADTPLDPHQLTVTPEDQVVVSLDTSDLPAPPPPRLAADPVELGPATRAVGALRFLPNLTLDESFGGDGIAALYVEPSDPQFSTLPIVVRDNGSVVVGVEICCRTNADGGTSPAEWQLVQWAVDGEELDSEFVGFSEAEDTTLGALAVRDDGGIVATGEIEPGEDGLDLLAIATFPSGSEGATVAHPGPPVTGVGGTALVRLADGSLRIAGWALQEIAGLYYPRQVMLARLDPAGSFDAEYGRDGNGGFVQHHGHSIDQARSVAVRSDGRIVAGGAIPLGGEAPPAGFVLQHGTNGQLDPNFAPAGTPGLDVTSYGGLNVQVESMVLDAQGRIVIAGTRDFRSAGVVMRLRPNGRPDPTFNGGSPVVFDLDDAGTEFFDVALDAEGRIVAVGDTHAIAECDDGAELDTLVAVRVRPNGAVDTGFGDNGVVRIGPDPSVFGECGDGLWEATAQGVALDRSGRIVITGASQADTEIFSPRRLLVARLLNSGVRDPSFPDDPILGDGVLLDEPIAGYDHEGRSVVVTRGGRIVVGGDAAGPTGLVVRYLSDGSRDDSFGDEGVAMIDVDSRTTSISAIAVDSFDNVVGVGQTRYAPPGSDYLSSPDILLVRLDSAGQLDPSFGTDGAVVTYVGSVTGADDWSAAEDVAIGEDGSIVVAGYAVNDRGTRAVVTRYHAERKVIRPPPTTTPTTPPPTTTPRPALALLPNSGPAGTAFEASGTRYVPGLPVRISLGGTLVGSLLASDVAADGSFTATVQVPAETVAGPKTVVACQRCGTPDDVTASATFTVTTTVEPPPPPPSLELQPPRGPIGTRVEVSGRNYAPSLPVRIRLGGERVGTLAGSDVTADGTFTTSVRVPERIPGGPQLVVACQRCDTPDEVSAPAVFTVTPELSVLPAVSRAGQVIEVHGEGFPTGPVTLTWSAGVRPPAVRADQAGRFEDWVLVFRGDTVGPRELEARVDGKVVATADVLVVPGSAQPGELVNRR